MQIKPGSELTVTFRTFSGLQWQWHDTEVRHLSRVAGLKLLGMLENPPAWTAGTTNYWQQWENYVARTVEHYKDDIHVWEVQNEPDLRWWLSKPEGPSRADNHVEYLRHTYPVIKRIDPTATVLGGSGIGGCYIAGSDGEAFTDELIQAGALQFMDAYSFHYYHSCAALQAFDELKEPLDVAVARLRARMKAAGKVVPILNSEGGVYDPAPAITYRPPTPDNYDAVSPALVARMYVTQLASGIERFFYFNAFINGTPYAKAWDSLLEGDGQPRPAVAAYAVVSWSMDDARFEKTERPTPDTWIYHFATPKGPLAVLCARSGTRTRLAVPGAGEAWDVVGTPVRPSKDGKFDITPDPLYVRLTGAPSGGAGTVRLGTGP